MRDAGASGHVPLDPADVIAGLVWPHLLELGAEPGYRGAVVARKQAVDAAGDRELERLEALCGDHTGPRPRGAPHATGRGNYAFHATAVAARPRSSWGGASTASTASGRGRLSLLCECLVGENEPVPVRVAHGA